MVNYQEFLQIHKPKIQYGFFSDIRIKEMAQKLPADAINFLVKEGISSYAGNFLWTTDPSSLRDVFIQWGLNPDKNICILRTAFGACIYYNTQTKKYYFLDPLLGQVGELAEDFDDLINMMLLLDTILMNAFFINEFKKLRDQMALQPDEIFSLVPAVASGGSFKISKIEIAKMTDHLCLLAKLYNNHARRI